jgi:hypothetical protein
MGAGAGRALSDIDRSANPAQPKASTMPMSGYLSSVSSRHYVRPKIISKRWLGV